MTKPLQKWKLPQPTDIKEDNEWISIPRISRTIPFGYELDKDDPDILQPIENELNMLEEAKKYHYPRWYVLNIEFFNHTCFYFF